MYHVFFIFFTKLLSITVVNPSPPLWFAFNQCQIKPIYSFFFFLPVKSLRHRIWSLKRFVWIFYHYSCLIVWLKKPSHHSFLFQVILDHTLNWEIMYSVFKTLDMLAAERLFLPIVKVVSALQKENPLFSLVVLCGRLCFVSAQFPYTCFYAAWRAAVLPSLACYSVHSVLICYKVPWSTPIMFSGLCVCAPTTRPPPCKGGLCYPEQAAYETCCLANSWAVHLTRAQAAGEHVEQVTWAGWPSEQSERGLWGSSKVNLFNKICGCGYSISRWRYCNSQEKGKSFHLSYLI